MKTLTPDDVSGEEQAELRSAFGAEALENGDIVRLEPGIDLQPVESPDYVLPKVLEAGDWVTLRHGAGNVTTGPVESVDDVGFHFDPRNRTAAGYMGYSTLGVDGMDVPLDTPGYEPRSHVIDINGEPAARVVQRRLDGEGEN